MTDNSTRPNEASTSTAAAHIGEEAVFDQLIRDEDHVLVDFYADWCGPCQMMAPTVDEVAAESDAVVVKVDVEELPQVAARYEVQSIPTFLVFHEGEIVERFVGMKEKQELKQTLA